MPAKQNPSSSPALTPQAYWRNPASQSLIRQAIEQSSTTPGSFLPNNEHINSEALKKIQHLSTLFEHSVKNSYKEEESGNQRDHINAKIRAELSTLYGSISGNTNSMNKFNNNSMNNYNNNYSSSGGSISKDFLCGHNLGSSTNINGSRPSTVTPPSPLPTSNNKASGLSTDRTNMLAGLNSLAASGIIPSNDTKKCLDKLRGPDGQLPQRLRNLPPNLIEQISNEIMDRDTNVRWDDIAGLQQVKECVTEMGIWPLLRPDIFQGCRSPGRGLLLFGPPGTGKTMIGKAIAGEAKATFFYVSASSLTGRWWGDAEKLVRALFGVASCRQPAVIFVDEIDSLLSKRKSYGENEASRKLKTQLFIEMEGFDSENDQILFIGATNRPQDLDEAARRRLTKRFYIPLPSSEARAWIVKNLLEKDGLFKLSKEDLDSICESTEGYSGSDMKNLVKDASMGPVREALKQGMEITKLNKEDMRPVSLQDFEKSLQVVRSSVSLDELGAYEDWNDKFGSLSTIETCDSVDRHRKKMRTDVYSTIYI